ncbi:MAG: type II and III secretion system protein [Planctomycetes bacterium]|nr:type II and III secretion system protein [Planctomycetota bacterium]MCB9885997.1 type II and III secretion system protein [Planctomycetota bacterium]
MSGIAVAACVSGPQKRVDPLVLDAEVAAGSAGRSGAALGPLAWGLGGGFREASAELAPAGSGQGQDPQETPEQRNARLRTQFGSTVLIGTDGRLTKQYFMAGELGTTFLKLIQEIADTPLPAGRTTPVPPPGTKIGGAQSKSILGRMLQGQEIEVTYMPDFEILDGATIVDVQPNKPAVTGAPLTSPSGAPTVALVLITAQPAALAAFEASLDLFYSSIPQIEITVQVIEYQTNDALAFGVSPIDANTPILNNLSSNQLVRSYTSAFPLRQPVVGASPVTDIGLFTLGGIHQSWELNMVLEALEANNLADIQSSPKLVVRNGGIASISTVTQVPFPKAKISQLGSNVATDIAFLPVGVKMNIIPTLAGTDSVILQIYADVSAITGFADTDPVVTPITSQRTAVTTVYLKDDHTLVIGGLTSESKFESETKVPILGDIPILGFLFRSTSTTRSKTTVEFLIRPRIVTDRGDPRSSMGL